MLRRLVAAYFMFCALCVPLAVGEGADRALDTPGGVASGRLIVSLKPATVQRLTVVAGAGPVDALRDPRAFLDTDFKTAATRWGVTGMRPLYLRPFANPALAAQLGLDRVYVLDAGVGADPQAMLASFAVSGDVESAFPDTIGSVALLPNDPDFPLQYAMDNSGQTAGGSADADIDAVEAWSIHTGDPGTATIAIIDSGVSPHAEFGSRLIAGINTDNPGNPTLTTDDCPHGTHVAGIAAASGDNSIGVAGVTWGANIMPVRVFNGCNGFVSNLAAGIVWAADHGADVLNMSVQFYNLTLPEVTNLQGAVNYAHASGALLVAAAGNGNLGGAGSIAFPARMNNVLAVTATDNTDTFASFSNYGSMVDLCAPGKDIWSTWIGDGYAYQFGTSMATPHVSGVAALLWSYEPSLTKEQVRDLIRFSTDDRGPPGWDSQYGEGRLNAWNALQSISCIQSAPSTEAVADEPVPFVKSRAVSFVPSNGGVMTALRVKLVSLHHPNPAYSGGVAISYAGLEGKYRWVGPPAFYMESSSTQEPFAAATLQCSPYFTDWGTVGLLHVFGAEIVPSSVYEVQAIAEGCLLTTAFAYSPAVQIATGRWADVETPFNPPEDVKQPDLSDVSALVNKFKNAPGAPIKARSVMLEAVPNLTNDLDFTQISACVDAFRGAGYPLAPPADCPP